MSLSSPPEARPRPARAAATEPGRQRRSQASRWRRVRRAARRLLRSPSRAVRVALGVAVLFVLVCGLRVSAAHRDLRAAEQSFLDARAAVVETRTDDASAALDAAEGHLRAARAVARSFPLGLLRPVPLLGSPARAVLDVADAGAELVAAGRVIAGAAAAFPTSGDVAVDGHDLSAFHRAAVDSEAALVRAKAHVERAAAMVDGAAGALLPAVSGPGRSARSTILDAAAELDGAERGLALLADLTAPGTRARLLVLSQDTMELRPTGGYIGSYGILELDGGRAELTEYEATEDLAPPSPPLDPPAEMARTLPELWGLSNANWWPSFPASASAARELFRRQGGGEVDGVVAVTEDVMGRLVGVFGPIEVPGYAEPVTDDGFADRVLYEVELKRPLDTPRKRFLTLLSDIVLDRVFSMSAEEVPAVVRALAAFPGEGQVWFADPARQRLVAGSTWAGELPAVDGDFLLLAEANVAAGKANRDLVRDAEYHVQRVGGRLHATLTVTFRNDGERSEVNPYYSGLLRVYVPEGSVLLEEPAGIRPLGTATDAPYDVFAADVYVEPEAATTLRLTYRLPERVSAGRYRLTWVRQVGVSRDVLRATIGGRQHVLGATARVLEVEADLAGSPVREFVRNRRFLRWLAR